MLTEDDILAQLDNFRLGPYCNFVGLGHPYSYLIDSRLNVFKGADTNWAIVCERTGYNPRGGQIELEIYYFGNCLMNLESYNGYQINSYTVYPVNADEFFLATDGESLKPDAEYWNIRGQQVPINFSKEEYLAAGIELKEFEPGAVNIEEAGRLLITKHQDLFRATDQELYKSIPSDLQKIMVLDEWYHRDFSELPEVQVDDNVIRQSYESIRNSSNDYPFDFEQFKNSYREQEKFSREFNQSQIENNRPSVYETWRLLARVIVTGDISVYKPTIPPNTHWRDWPESGSL